MTPGCGGRRDELEALPETLTVMPGHLEVNVSGLRQWLLPGVRAHRSITLGVGDPTREV
jgi:hypothetical protein